MYFSKFYIFNNLAIFAKKHIFSLFYKMIFRTLILLIYFYHFRIFVFYCTLLYFLRLKIGIFELESLNQL